MFSFDDVIMSNFWFHAELTQRLPEHDLATHGVIYWDAANFHLGFVDAEFVNNT